jgi:uncharacterized membrane protein YeaQ/YmgE (transglycosylase-associated protein family)
MVIFIIVLLIVGFIVGAIARLLMPGRDSIGVLGTIIGAWVLLLLLRLTGTEPGRRRYRR